MTGLSLSKDQNDTPLKSFDGQFKSVDARLLCVSDIIELKTRRLVQHADSTNRGFPTDDPPMTDTERMVRWELLCDIQDGLWPNSCGWDYAEYEEEVRRRMCLKGSSGQ